MLFYIPAGGDRRAEPVRGPLARIVRVRTRGLRGCGIQLAAGFGRPREVAGHDREESRKGTSRGQKGQAGDRHECDILTKKEKKQAEATWK